MNVIPDSPLALVVDDDAAVLDLIGEVLESLGILTMAMTDPAAVLEQAAAHRPALIILDVMMPEMDGYTLAAKLRKDPRTVSIDRVPHRPTGAHLSRHERGRRRRRACREAVYH